MAFAKKTHLNFTTFQSEIFKLDETTEYQEVKGNREVKSSLFAKIFSDKKELLELFNAVNGTEAQ